MRCFFISGPWLSRLLLQLVDLTSSVRYSPSLVDSSHLETEVKALPEVEENEEDAIVTPLLTVRSSR